VEFDEATAILAGDALLTEAFIALADLGPRAADAIRVLGRRGGTEELLAGQANDLHFERGEHTPSFSELEHIHRGKTGALFAAAAELGGISADCSANERKTLAELGMTIGIAFQHGDDRLDDEHEAHREQARARVEELARRAAELVAGFGESAAPLRAMVQWIAVR
jgi:geranylgeranyl pyrophosphate synthase